MELDDLLAIPAPLGHVDVAGDRSARPQGGDRLRYQLVAEVGRPVRAQQLVDEGARGDRPICAVLAQQVLDRERAWHVPGRFLGTDSLRHNASPSY